MSDVIPVEKNEEEQSLIPSLWRNTFKEIVEGLKEQNYMKVKDISGVQSFLPEDMEEITSNIESYGDHLINLPDDSWKTSVCQWVDGGWDVLIDLFTIEEGASDLVLSVKVYEVNSSYRFKIQGVYVP